MRSPVSGSEGVGTGGRVAQPDRRVELVRSDHVLPRPDRVEWTAITPEILFNEIIGLPSGPAACAVAAWNANPDLPPYIVVGAKQAVGQGGVIAENNPNFATGKASDGKGIDHGEEAFNPAIGAILGQCLG